MGADLGGANLVEARLANANLTMANLAEANLTGAEFGKAKGLREALLAETCRAEPGGPSQFETVERRGLDRHWDWERVRVFGRLPLFGVSYAALILVPVMMYLLAFYNARVADLNELGVKTTAALQNYPATTPKENAQRDALLAVADFLQGAERQAIPSQSFLLLVSTVLLAIASTVYTIACPSRVKEFSRDQWCDQLKQPLIHYWPMCWRSAPLRVVCLVCYTLGGLGALWVLAVKVFRAGRYILEHSEFGLW
ncbi:MAG: pentapeptide repeat-containing protein [Acidobacteriota bacterium]